MTMSDASALSSFQSSCAKRLSDALQVIGLSLANARIEGERERYLVAEVGGTSVQVWIYVDEAMFAVGKQSFYFEAPDYPDPNARITAFVSGVLASAQGGAPPDKGSARVPFFRGRKL